MLSMCTRIYACLYKIDVTEYFIESIVPIKYMDLTFPLVLKGSGQPTFTFSTDDSDIQVTANPHPVNVTIDSFDPCLGKGVLTLDRFYANSEAMTMEEDTYPQKLTRSWWEFAYGDYKSSNIDGEPTYVFPFTINNLNPIVVDENVEGKNNSGGVMVIEFNMKLTHKPRD